MEEIGLSQQEKDKLMEVMEKAREFDETNKEGRLQQQAYTPTEGQLYKWTNPLKGWQPRYFYVNQIQGVLHYCMSEEKKKLPPRASLHLWGAVVSPSDEDSQSFTIQGINNECYRLKAANAKDRQLWVSKMRMEVERANTLLGSKELTPHDKSTVSLGLNSPSSVSHSAEPTPQKTTNFKKHSRKSQLSAPSLNLSLTKLTGKKKYNKKPVVGEGVTGTSASVGFPGGEDMLDAFTRLQMLQDTLTEQLEMSISDAGATPDNTNVLLLKATSRAAVSSVQDCLAMLTPPTLPVYTSSDSPVHGQDYSNGGTASTLTQSLSTNPSTLSPSRKVSRSKRPMSMIDSSTRHHSRNPVDNDDKGIEDDLDSIVLRSSSTSEVHGENKHKNIVQRKLSKEAP